jgi:hypothetical protein
MAAETRVIVGIGELLWDILPSGKVLGGAPANFIYHVWLRNYWEHIIRNDDTLERIRYYIRANPNHWDGDWENPGK